MSHPHVEHSRTILLQAPVEQVFPLFTPRGESHWAAEWQPHFLYPESGASRWGTAFLTHGAAGATGETIWILNAYDPAAHHLCYTRITPGALAGLVAVTCAAHEPGTTAATVTYSVTALGAPGSAYLETFTATHYAAMMGDWERAINHYLHTGAALAHH